MSWATGSAARRDTPASAGPCPSPPPLAAICPHVAGLAWAEQLAVGYEVKVSEAEEQRILAYYEKQLDDARWRKRYPLHTRYRLARDYHGVDHQCTSVALDGWKKHTARER